MKKIISMLLALLLMTGSASATILPATGVDERYRDYTGLTVLPAVVLCESLTVLDQRGDMGGKAVSSLSGGTTVPVYESWDGYAKIVYGESGATFGWVRSDYLMMDPAWYLCDSDLQVYAYPDSMAPRIALLDAGTKLPILLDTEVDGRGWVCVSLRNASGWIRKVPADTVNETSFRPSMVSDLKAAKLTWQGWTYSLTDPAALRQLSDMLVSANDLGGPMAGCPFRATLELATPAGETFTLELATDSCCTYSIDGRHYQYARNLRTGDSSVDNTVLFSLFGVELILISN